MFRVTTKAEDAKMTKEIAPRFTLRATIKRNVVTGFLVMVFLLALGLVADDIKPVMALVSGVLFVPIGILLDQTWYKSYKKKVSSK